MRKFMTCLPHPDGSCKDFRNDWHSTGIFLNPMPQRSMLFTLSEKHAFHFVRNIYVNPDLTISLLRVLFMAMPYR